MTRSKTQKRSLNEKNYLRIMIPHVATEEAKSIGLADRQGKEWKSLVKKVRNRLEERYRKFEYTNPNLLQNDMCYKRSKSKNSFKKESSQECEKQIESPETECTSDFENNMLVDMVAGATKLQKEWMKEKRIELLKSISIDEADVLLYLNKHDIEAYAKVPFIVGGTIFFADIYLPDLNIIIDISNVYKRRRDDGEWIKDRYRKIKKTGCFLIKIEASQLKNKNFIHNLAYKVIVSKKKQQENY